MNATLTVVSLHLYIHDTLFHSPGYRREQAGSESPKATAQRARRSREEQIAAEERRKVEQEARRIRKQQEREQGREQAPRADHHN